jgi:hypothetical protein
LEAHGIDRSVFTTGREEEIGLFVGIEEVPESQQFISRPALPPIDYSSPRPVPDPPRPATPAETQPKVETTREVQCSGTWRNRCHVCSLIPLAPGKMLLFSVPREYLCKKQLIFITYKYAWEDGGNQPEHRVYFSGWRLANSRFNSAKGEIAPGPAVRFSNFQEALNRGRLYNTSREFTERNLLDVTIWNGTKEEINLRRAPRRADDAKMDRRAQAKDWTLARRMAGLY